MKKKTENKKQKTNYQDRKTKDDSLNTEHYKLKILIAPLNWGIGHATRCVPIIKDLIKQGFIPILASDGEALLLLQKEFPKLKSFELPSYQIEYSKKAILLKLKLLFQVPKILKQIKKEQKFITKLIEKENIKGIISDNRFGVYSDKIPSVYITHQISVLSGFTTFFTSKLHQKIINKFDECWVPDTKGKPRLAGKLSNAKNLKTKVNYLGVLSRFTYNKNQQTELKNDILVLLSGLEPQRTLLENKLISELKNSTKKILFVRGIISEKNKIINTNYITYKNYLLQNELEIAIKQSDLIISRSGYSTIMDLAVLQRKVFFIPTPGQTEQEYLARHLANLKIAPYCRQHKFTFNKLKELKKYSGFKSSFFLNNNFPFRVFITGLK